MADCLNYGERNSYSDKTMAERRYSTTTIKVLFGASGNQCAFPECTNPIIAPETFLSDAAVVGQICHIYAAADNGPRGKSNLTEEERNAPGNLLLMCGFHHPIVDKQWADYPATTLISWKKAHEAKYQQDTAEALKQQEKMQQNAFLRSLSDQEIDKEIERIRKARYFIGFRVREAATTLAARVEKTELAGGSAEHRARALAWCARFLALGETADRARELLRQSRELAATPEADIAEAFIISETDKQEALTRLAAIDLPAARSAALRIVINHDKVEGALAWVQKTGVTLASFDAEGKFYHTTNQITAGRWDDAIHSAANLSEEDLNEAPALLQIMAVTQLIQAVPEQLRAVASSQVPFEAADFPLSSDTEAALEARRMAISYFDRVSAFAISIGAAGASNAASDHALWLKLRDPSQHEKALEELRTSMRDDKQSLRRVHLALQFGVKLDIDAIEKKIDQNLALAGKGTSDEAIARFALAFAKSSPKAVAEYIAAHRTELYEHLQKSAVIVAEIEMLARAGLKDAAEKRLAEEVAAGLGEREQQHLGQMVMEVAGADPATERRKLYEQTGNVTDLINLVNVLERHELWDELCLYAEKLFSITHSLEDGFRFARSLDRTEQYARLLEFLSAHIALVAQSPGLKTMLAWSLYRDGQFNAAAATLDQLAATRDDPNDRALRVQIAIASGRWHELVQHTTDEWNNRERRSAKELLAAGELAQAVGAPHARELVTAATAKAPDDPIVLAGAYFHSTNAGWEQDEVTAKWLTTAAALSGDDGPIKSVSMKELVERKPEWDKRQASVWDQLNEGKIPVFGAAHLLNRSLIDFVLLPSLANLNERDPRRRSIVYAYSGARSPVPLKPKKVALDLGAIFTFARLDLLETIKIAYEIAIPHLTLSWLFHERQRATFHQPSRIRDAHDLKRLIADGSIQVLRTQTPPDHALAKEVGIDLAGLLLTAEGGARAGGGIPRYVIRSSPVHRIGSLLQEEADLTAYSPYLCSCHALVEKLRTKGILTRKEEQRALAYLKLQERRWPSESAIGDGAELFLDNVSVSYLRTVGVLGKLKAAGLTVHIPESEDDDSNRLIAFEHISSQQLEVIETIRESLAEGLKSGRVRAVRSTQLEEKDKPFKIHPTLAILSLESEVDAFVVDDRFVNRYLTIDGNDRKTPILSSLDVMDDLAEKQLVSAEDLFAHRTYLRQAGYQLVSVNIDELLHHLGNAPLRDGQVVETAELRAIRESLLRARMSKMLQIPLETPWLHQTMRSIMLCIKQLWKVRTEPAEAVSYSEWLVELLDVRGWAPSALPGNERGFALFAYAAHVQALMTAPEGSTDEVKDAYQNWVDERLVKDLRETHPEAFAWIVARAREMISQAADKAADDLKA